MSKGVQRFVPGAVDRRSTAQASESTADLGFDGKVLTGEDIPALDSVFAARPEASARVIVRHHGLVKRRRGQPVEMLTAWLADEQGIIIAEMTRELERFGEKFRAVGRWRVDRQHNHQASTVMRRRTGIVAVTLNSDDDATNPTSSSACSPLHRTGFATEVYLPAPVVAGLNRTVPEPEIYCGELRQYTSAVVLSQTLHILRTDASNVIVLKAEREISNHTGAEHVLAKESWNVTQITCPIAGDDSAIAR